MKHIILYLFISLFSLRISWAQEYDKLWLRYEVLPTEKVKELKSLFDQIQFAGVSGRLEATIRKELEIGLDGLLNLKSEFTTLGIKSMLTNGLLVGTTKSTQVSALVGNIDYLGKEGFYLKYLEQGNSKVLLLAANSEEGLLYGTFKLLQHLQWGTNITTLDSYEKPQLKVRYANHWDDPSGHVERGYAGKSMFDWSNLGKIKPRYVHYARLMTSMGINGAVINNVNTLTNQCTGWKLLKSEELDKLSRYSDLLWRHGMKTYISINFTAPELIGGLDTSDPLDSKVIAWWEAKAAECADKLVGFGGFLVKADSEGEKGPIYYNRNHADGANMLADAISPYDGTIIWRAFVYGVDGLSEDRVMHAYENFHPLDGKFRENVILQSKNGPWDFQVREPVAPLFGAMQQTNMALEIQGTQEYTGQSTHTVYLVPQWKEVLNFDTYSVGKGSTLEALIKGDVFDYPISGMSCVLNFGADANWTGNYLAQANTYGMGRLAWNPSLSSEEILEEWIKMTFGNNQSVINTLKSIMLDSWQVYEAYTSPLGLGFLTDYAHFSPAPVLREFMHFADDTAIGVDRSVAGTGFAAQYHQPWQEIYSDINTCPEELLLFFHRVPYEHKLKSGKTLVQHVYDTHFDGAEKVKGYLEKWQSIQEKIDEVRFQHISKKLEKQLEEAELWRDTINGYFYFKTKLDDEKNRLTQEVKTIFPKKEDNTK